MGSYKTEKSERRARGGEERKESREKRRGINTGPPIMRSISALTRVTAVFSPSTVTTEEPVSLCGTSMLHPVWWKKGINEWEKWMKRWNENKGGEGRRGRRGMDEGSSEKGMKEVWRDEGMREGRDEVGGRKR